MSVLVKVFVNSVWPLGQVDKLSVQMTKDFFFFMSSRKKFCRGFVSTFPSAYTMSYFFSEKINAQEGKKIKITVAVSKTNKVKQT